MDLSLVEGSGIAKIYGSTRATEQYYCNFAVNPEFLDAVRSGPIEITGSDAEGEVRVVEYPDHPFFIATLFVPQTLSTPGQPHPLINAFLAAEPVEVLALIVGLIGNLKVAVMKHAVAVVVSWLARLGRREVQFARQPAIVTAVCK